MDNILRVVDYDQNLWPTTVESDLPVIRDHIKGAWDSKDSGETFMKLLGR